MANRAELANAIRALAMDAVQKANSGHPGMPMGMAEIALALWGEGEMRFNPQNPDWANRDRFILSNGHGSMLQYALLHLTGYDVSIDDLKNFRQLHSKTPGHPEYGYTVGVETTTGPLGQGITNAVGFALAEKLLAREFNKPGFDIVDHHTYCFLGDGCLMEGISHEAAALAGTWGLGKLVAFWDDNGISIDGHVEGWFTDDTPGRFEAYGWHVIRPIDGHDVDAVKKAIAEAKAVTDKPSLICCKTIIGKGSPNKANSHDSHGAPLGDAEIKATRDSIGWLYEPFEIPASVYAGWDKKEAGAKWESEWDRVFKEYAEVHPDLAAEFKRRNAGELPANWNKVVADAIAEANTKAETIATRKASQNALSAYVPNVPEMLGGSADLTGSNLTNWKGSTPLRREGNELVGDHISYGVREFGMSAIMNGIQLHGGWRPYGATFLMFSEYARNALRMAALMKIPTLFVFTHDSIGLGEDGPTHQAVEQTATLRLIPNMNVWRPADTIETLVAWADAIEQKQTPSTLIFTRQNLQFQARTEAQIADIKKGGYVLRDAADAKVVLIATGSELDLIVKAAEKLAAEGIAARVVSMPSTNVFDKQDKAYQASVLPAGVPRLAVEAGVTDGWRKYVGLEGDVIGLDRFGESAPAGELFKLFGFTVDNVVARAKALVK
ncbi:transketolase [Jeongeupia chitinilytica]|uniref:Transketolase n=1 Tax=Jeongeupia chitinilytica TaxID=1041641 RepID=A0ABQ3H2C9_9NEIS|nr:transketolase [Jeongeupia chitinilytica]GHD66791.1 transketolase 2 [Jeongeupia chitinilytica]